MAKKKKIILGILGLIILLFVGIVGRHFLIKPQSKYITEKATRKNLIRTVSATGELVANKELELSFEIGGRIKDIPVKVGQAVAQGEVIAILDNSILSREAEEARLALEKAIADANTNDDQIREAKQAASNAKKYLKEIEDLEDQKVEAADRAYEDAKTYYESALSYYNQVVDEKGESSSTAKSAKMTLVSAENSKHSAEEAKDTARKSRDVAVTSAENTLKTAKEQLKTVQSEMALKGRNAAVAAARQKYEIALENLKKASLKAPVNGVITKINYEVGEVLGTANLTAAGNAFGKMLSNDLLLESNVPETDISELMLGQKAEVTFDALSEDDKFEAEIIEIEPAATVIQDVVYYKVKLKLSQVDQRLKAGMSADIVVKVKEKPNVLAIPRRAIKKENGKKTVKILLDGDQNIREQAVVTGLESDDGNMEIISGLKEGDTVIVSEEKNK
jgi:RND family efflux transporter MFP subunit